MNYELAKQLKDGGFLQELKEGKTLATCGEECPFSNGKNPNSVGEGNNYMDMYNEHRESHYTYIPTLSELIEACNGELGQRFRWLKNHKTHWVAQARPKHAISKKYPNSPIERGGMGKDLKGQGKTPEEAVAKLWLELNSKEL